MAQLIVSRLAQALVVVFLVSLTSFVVTVVLPGDPVMALMGQEMASESFIQAKREELGLDRPIQVQYFYWLGGVLTGELGKSLRTGHTVTSMLVARLPVTVHLMLTAILIAILVAVPWAIVSARSPGSPIDVMGTLFATSGQAIPNFWLGMMFILVFSVWLKLLPPFGYVDPTRDLMGSLRHIIMPAIVLGTAVMAEVMRHLRSSLLEALNEPYISTARSKGLSERVVVLKHAMRIAAIPVVSLLGLRLGTMIGGTVIVEVVFSLPGIGQMAMNAILARDGPVIQSMVLWVASGVVVINAAIDVLYGLLDPRIRVQ